MKAKSVLIVGCGDLGARVGALLLAQEWHVFGIRRDPSRVPADFDAYGADYTAPDSLKFVAGLRPDHVLATFTPVNSSLQGYRSGFVTAMENLLAGLAAHRPRTVIMVSSTRVFAERDGGWVDEDSPLVTDDPRGQAIIESEQRLRISGHNASIVRCGGIYGLPGGRLIDRVRRGELCAEEPPRFSNRIHRDDCAGFLSHLLLRSDEGVELAPVYIAVDDLPAPQFEVESWLAREMGVRVMRESLPATDTARPAPGNHKRCRNNLLHASGYALQYPDFRSGYRAVLAGGD